MFRKKTSEVKQKFNHFLRILGPGLITGAADDDPSGIATYSQTGAQFGYGQLWTALFLFPLQTALQEACARIGAVTGKGIAAVVKYYYGKRVLSVAVLLIFIANTINIGADIGAMAAAIGLIVPVNFFILMFMFAVVILLLEIFTSYRVYARILKWLSLSLLAYVGTVFMVSQPWKTLLFATLVPHVEFNFQFLFLVTGVLGTTISPYMFFWQASEETEEAREKQMIERDGRPHITARFMRDLRIDNVFGMFFSQVGMWSIIVVAATILHAHGITDIKTAADAARALEPLVQTFPNAGYVAKLIFAFGIVGLGLLAVPVLSGSAAYAVGEALNWHVGLNLKLKKAYGFYGVIIVATILGLLINFIGIDPIKALVYAGVINGVIAVPLIFLIARIAQNEKIMGEHKSGMLSKLFVWLTFAVMGVAAFALLFTFGRR